MSNSAPYIVVAGGSTSRSVLATVLLVMGLVLAACAPASTGSPPAAAKAAVPAVPSAPAAAPTAASPPRTETVKYAASTSVSSAGAFIGLERGYYR